jgi:(E)-4-hydroxy-3-methylbut-2-enyl-diphosphate synthase
MKDIKRKKTKIIKIGGLKIGGNFPVAIQSMTNTATSDIKRTIQQIKQLEAAGCEIIRVAVPDFASARAIGKIKERINIPLVADIHFSSQFAMEAVNQGADKIRINPGNFPKDDLKKLTALANKKGIPIRVGINSGSIEKEILAKSEIVTPEMMVRSALKNIKLMENLGFNNMVISLKASDIVRTVKAYQMLSKITDYPLHLGITEAGTEFAGTIKSSIGLGYLLLNGIGDTIRISLSAEPAKEVKVAWELLKSLGLRNRGLEIISCPTCGRTEIDVINIAKSLESFDFGLIKPLKVAVMGCVVNGLGEAREADLAAVGVKKFALLMKGGKELRKIKKEEVLAELKKEIKKLT